MDEPPAGQHWNRVYATRPDSETSWFELVPATSLALIGRCALPPSAGIIDVGSGLSRLAEALLDAGFRDLTLLDISAAALERVRARLGPRAGGVRFIAADVARWQPDRTFDLWHDRAVLHFLVGEADRAGYRAALLAATHAGSKAVIATFAPGGPERCSGLPVRRYGCDEMAGFLGPDFRLLESREVDHLTPAGVIQRFHFALAERLQGPRPG